MQSRTPRTDCQVGTPRSIPSPEQDHRVEVGRLPINAIVRMANGELGFVSGCRPGSQGQEWYVDAALRQYVLSTRDLVQLEATPRDLVQALVFWAPLWQEYQALVARMAAPEVH